MTTPLLSFLYPIKTRADLFARTLDSFVCQVDPLPYEILVLDDGSTDDLASLVRYYAQDAPPQFRLPLRYFRLDVTQAGVPIAQYAAGGHGPSIAWNVGIRQARGEWVVISSPEIVLRSATSLGFLGDHCRFANGFRGASQLPTNAIICNVYDRTWADTFTEGWIGGGPAKRKFHFLAAYDRARLTGLGGFDERFMAGRAFDDDELVARWEATGGSWVFTGAAVVAEHLPHARAEACADCETNRVLYERVRGQLVANAGHEWGSAKCIVEQWP